MHKRDVTIILATSIIPAHPSTDMIDETIKSIRHHFPNNEIIMQIDGLRSEQMNRKPDYDEYKNRILWKCLHEYKNVLPIIFNKHSHQSTMLKQTINLIDTPCLLYVEGDAPITGDRHIDWNECLDMLEFGKANTIRFHFEASIPLGHSHLMLKKKGNFLQTIQWSQRPHLSRVDYYREEVLRVSDEKTFIEDKFHGVVQDDGWVKHKLWIYHPEGDIKRSYHLDGREGTRKFTSDDEAWGLTE